jgi:hypothetical protein
VGLLRERARLRGREPAQISQRDSQFECADLQFDLAAGIGDGLHGPSLVEGHDKHRLPRAEILGRHSLGRGARLCGIRL